MPSGSKREPRRPFQLLTVEPVDDPAVLARFTASAPVDMGSRGHTFWLLVCDLAVRDDDLVLTRLELRPRFDSVGEPAQDKIARGVTRSVAGDMVRAIQFGELLRQVHTRLKKHPELMAEFAEQGHTLPPEQVARAKRAAARVPREELRRGRKGYSPDFYRWVAHQYLDLQAKNKGRGIREVIAEEGRKRPDRTEPVPLDTVKTWLRRARELEFIVFEKQGRVGASAGPKLYAEEEQ